MTDGGLTAAQRAFVDGEADTFVQACPGAGKTRAIVYRYLRRTAEETRRGIALVSFTNVAIDEVRERCGAQLDALQAPNFVGTFDAFINRYFTSPLYARRYRRPVSYVESWDALPSGQISKRQYQVSLEYFDYDQTGNATFVPGRVQGTFRVSLIREIENNLQSYCRRATGRRRALIENNGVASASASRWFARTQLADPAIRALLTRHIAARFAEVIVDEAQDCGADELAILEFLREAGVAATLVADRDQAIFEFRRATPQQLDTFVSDLSRGKALDGNFRSSPAICALNDSLRHGTDADKPIGRHVGVATPIQLITYKNLGDLPARIRATTAAHGLVEQDVVVLAHATRDAQQAAGAGKVSTIGDSKIVCIADCAQRLLARGSDSRIRLRAIQDVERVLLGRLEDELPGHATLDALCELYDLDRQWLREAAVRVLMCARPAEHDRTRYAARIQVAVESIPFPPQLAVRRVTQYLRTPSVDQWGKLGMSPQEVSLTWGTVHSVKGQEFPAVALVIPKSPRKGEDELMVLDHWEAGINTEPRRVLYVGASRAQKLLMLAVHANHADRVRNILGRDGVPFGPTA